MDEPTDYTNSGFDKFLSRGDTPNLGGTLDQAVPNNSVPFDRQQVTGPLGDTFRIGNILLDGRSGQIAINDNNNNKRIILGTQSDGSEGLLTSKQGTDADINRPKDTIFNSALNLFQVTLADTYTFPAITTATNVVQQFKIAHNANGIPAFVVYGQVPSNPSSVFYPYVPAIYSTPLIDQAGYGDGRFQYLFNIAIDNTNLYVNLNCTPISGTPTSTQLRITYYVYQQTIATI